jgi:tetratricopeptide (TPR) repeat protein
VLLLVSSSFSITHYSYQARTLTPRRANGKTQSKSKIGSFRANTMPARNAARKRKSCEEAVAAPNRVSKPSKSSSSAAAPVAKKQKTTTAARKKAPVGKKAPVAAKAKAQSSSASASASTPAAAAKEAKVTTGPTMSNLKGMMLDKDPKQQLLELAVQGDTLLAAGQFEQAIAVLTQAIELAQSNKAKSTLHHARSLVYAHEDVEMYDEAVEDTDMAIQLNAMRDV